MQSRRDLFLRMARQLAGDFYWALKGCFFFSHETVGSSQTLAMSTPNPIELVNTLESRFFIVPSDMIHVAISIIWKVVFCFRSFDFRLLSVSANNGPGGVLRRKIKSCKYYFNDSVCWTLHPTQENFQLAADCSEWLAIAKPRKGAWNGGIDRPWSFNRKSHSCHLILGR